MVSVYGYMVIVMMIGTNVMHHYSVRPLYNKTITTVLFTGDNDKITWRYQRPPAEPQAWPESPGPPVPGQQ